MEFSYIAQQMINGLILGSMYALVAIGFSMIYNIIRLINFAHGDIVMIGAFITLGLVMWGQLPFVLVVLVVLGFAALVGVLIERCAFRPMLGRTPGCGLHHFPGGFHPDPKPGHNAAHSPAQELLISGLSPADH